MSKEHAFHLAMAEIIANREEAWTEVDKEDADDVAYFMRETLEWDFSDVYWPAGER